MPRRRNLPRPNYGRTPSGPVSVTLSTGEFLKLARDHKHEYQDNGNGWCGGSWSDAEEWAKDGWEDGKRQATPIAEHALETLEKYVEVDRFEAEWDKTGSEVDVGRYLMGVPECMIEYQPVRVSNVGKVVTLCASISASAAVSADSIIKRGAAVVGLAQALEDCQHSVEIYVDLTQKGYSSEHLYSTKVLIKGANDSIDPGVLAYWLSNPTVLRRFALSYMHSYPPEWQDTLSVGGSYGTPTNPVENLPEGTIYLPCVYAGHDVPDADQFIIDTLKQLELIDN